MPRMKSGRATLLDSRASRRSVLRIAVAGAAGALCALAVGLDRFSGRGRAVFAQSATAGPRSRCSSCGRSVCTGAGYVICEACAGTACPRCARVRQRTFFCPTCVQRA